ncbi:MAG TPA: MFS transporter, partial [Myxococcota bacterium]|nr:MFS transporter [Myxococcota bacterium]
PGAPGQLGKGAAPHRPQLPPAEVEALYPRYRMRVLEATFLGYASFYLVRNNLSVVAKDLGDALGHDKETLGDLLGVTAISYGLGKFLLGAISDRSDARVFMATGLALTALCNFAFGATTDATAHLWLWALNGFFQGMGWPPCGRSMAHWFSERERGLTFSVWNTSHNVGGGIAGVVAGYAASRFGGWSYAFFVPGVIATISSVYLFFRLVDTPQSVGLPPVEVYRDDRPPAEAPGVDHEAELPFRSLFVDHVLRNRLVWLLAVANFFAYISRYVMLDWGPTYLREVKGATLEEGGWAVLALEFGGIPSTIALGWLSDRLGGRRGMVACLCMAPILAAFLVIRLTPAGHPGLDLAMLVTIGFCIYPVINLIVIMALDVTSKKAIGTAAGFIGLFGYLGKTVQAKGFGRLLDQVTATAGREQAWDQVLWWSFASSVLAMLLLATTWRIRPRA